MQKTQNVYMNAKMSQLRRNAYLLAVNLTKAADLKLRRIHCRMNCSKQNCGTKILQKFPLLTAVSKCSVGHVLVAYVQAVAYYAIKKFVKPG